jgi:hypothetical protein
VFFFMYEWARKRERKMKRGVKILQIYFIFLKNLKKKSLKKKRRNL